jgi:plasmid replication initiation protein
LAPEYKSIVMADSGRYVTELDLETFHSIKGKYGKLAYLLCCEHRSDGAVSMPVHVFRYFFGVGSVRRMEDITRDILPYIQRELAKIFGNFRIEKAREGRNVTQISFLFDAGGAAAAKAA